MTVNGLHVEVEHLKQWRKRDEEFSNCELQNDPSGQYRYSKLRLAFLLPPDADASTIVLHAVNRLVDVYRYTSQRAYLHPLQLHQLEDLLVEQPGTHEAQVIVAFGADGIGMAHSDDDAQLHDRVGQLLASDEPIPLYAELLFTGDRLNSLGYHRQAVIDSVSALDVFVEELIRDRLSTAGRSAADIDDLLYRNRDIGDRMKQPLEEAIGWRVSADAALWTDWLRVNGTRRDATHRGARTSFDEAADALSVVRSIIHAVLSKME